MSDTRHLRPLETAITIDELKRFLAENGIEGKPAAFCAARAETGMAKYGPITPKDRNFYQEAAEELADAVNYLIFAAMFTKKHHFPFKLDALNEHAAEHSVLLARHAACMLNLLL